MGFSSARNIARIMVFLETSVQIQAKNTKKLQKSIIAETVMQNTGYVSFFLNWFLKFEVKINKKLK